MALCGLLSALAVAVMLLGSLFPMAVYCCPILAMGILLPIRDEFGTQTALTAYAAVAILTLLLAADRELAGIYLFLGWYPAAQPYFYRLRPSALRILAILAACNGCVVAMYALLLYVIFPDTAVLDFFGCSGVMLGVLLVMGNVVFLITDFLLRRLSRLWKSSLRRRWFRGK